MTEKINSELIKSKSSIYVSLMYSPAPTKRRNKWMITRKELKRLDLSIQTFVKYRAKLMVRKAGEREYSMHGRC